MQRKWMSFLVVLMLLVQPMRTVKTVGIILYVTPTGLAAGSCTSWATACDLQYALGMAAPGSALWVNQGTYHPTSSSNRTISFVLKNEVALYGGFEGSEVDLSQRDPDANTTILSGDIGVLNDNRDNSFHVVVGSNTNNTAVLDGFTIRNGNAGEWISDNTGGGMYIFAGSPTLTNVIFNENSALLGGGMYIVGGSPVLRDVTFNNNSAANEGGGCATTAPTQPWCA